MKLQLEKKKQEEATPKSILKVSRKTTQPSGVSSLLTRYDSDDSPPTKEEKSRVSWPENDSKLTATHVIDEPQSSKRARFAVDSSMEPTTNQVETIANAGETVGTAEESTKSEIAKREAQLDSSADAETWNEFEALLNDERSKSEPDEPEEEPAETFEDSLMDTTEMEQASYEARIAQLRLRAAARRNKKVAVVQIIDTYTPELAEGGAKRSSDDTMTTIEILRQKKRAKIQAEDDDS
jgi:hypothetical protein